MSEETTDRRERRTRQALHRALVSLMMEKPYDAITVQDIIDRADVGRSTFYTHYMDKEDLFRRQFQYVLEQLGRQVAEGGDAPDEPLPVLALFRHVAEHYELYRAVVRGRGIEVLYRAGYDFLKEQIDREIQARQDAGGRSIVPPAIVSQYVAGTLQTLLRWWLENRMPYSPELMDAYFWRLVTPGLDAADLQL